MVFGGTVGGRSFSDEGAEAWGFRVAGATSFWAGRTRESWMGWPWGVLARSRGWSDPGTGLEVGLGLLPWRGLEPDERGGTLDQRYTGRGGDRDRPGAGAGSVERVPTTWAGGASCMMEHVLAES